MSESVIQSPCILVCAIEPASGHCFGCGRSRDEIASWVQYSTSERDAIMTDLPERLSKLERKPRRVTKRSLQKGSSSRVTTFDDQAG